MCHHLKKLDSSPVEITLGRMQSTQHYYILGIELKRLRF